MERWTPVKVPRFETVDKQGRKIVLKDVPAEHSKKRNITHIDLDEIIKRVRTIERSKKTPQTQGKNR